MATGDKATASAAISSMLAVLSRLDGLSGALLHSGNARNARPHIHMQKAVL
jgi:hypothetical protein